MAGSVALFQRNWLQRDYLKPIETALFYWSFSMFPSPCILSCTHKMVLYVHINHIHPFYLEFYGPVQNARKSPIICTTYWIDQQTNILFAIPTAICPVHISPLLVGGSKLYFPKNSDDHLISLFTTILSIVNTTSHIFSGTLKPPTCDEASASTQRGHQLMQFFGEQLSLGAPENNAQNVTGGK